MSVSVFREEQFGNFNPQLMALLNQDIIKLAKRSSVFK
jgi:hypothetical protein